MRQFGRLRFETLELRRYLTSYGWDGPGLGAASLTYYIGEVPSHVDEQDFHDAMQQAFGVWSGVANIDFTETTVPRQRNSVDIQFTELDGPNGTLAQAYFPDDVNRGRIAGDILFDIEEDWEFGNARRSAATDVLLVAVHELGHALGLEHSSDRDDVMFASVPSNASFQSLSPGDRAAILDLYAPRPLALIGDVNRDGSLSSLDIDRLAESIRLAENFLEFDLSGDQQITFEDHRILIQHVLNTDYGDANLDGGFDSSDLTLAFQFGVYENDAPSVAAWVAGDWNGDGKFSSDDLILALNSGTYVV